MRRRNAAPDQRCIVDLRELKALELAARSRLVFHLGRWLVPSQSSGKTYSVSLSPPSCTCEDFELRGEPCKHVIAARLVAARDGGESAPPMDTDAVPKRPTYKQDWPKYNAAQQSEKDRFHELLADLLVGVEEPPGARTGRKRTPMRDRIFASCLKVFVGFSSRHYACDLRDAHERGFLSQLMNSMSVIAILPEERHDPHLVGRVNQPGRIPRNRLAVSFRIGTSVLDRTMSPKSLFNPLTVLFKFDLW